LSDILLTGGTGFVGRHLVERLVADGRSVRCAIRSPERSSSLPSAVSSIAVGELGFSTDWRDALAGVGTVMHLAARAHVLDEREADPLAVFLEVNTRAVETLATAAAQAGVRRLVFLSSIKVNGEDSGERAYAASDAPAPADPYGVSKQRAEEALREIGARTGMQTVIVRPPLVYGPGVRANFLRLMQIVDRGIPLPFGSIRNRRSLVSVWNLCDLLVRCVDSPAAANRTFMVSDGVDPSTAELVRLLATALEARARVFGVPPAFLRLAARLTGQMAEYTRLCASLRVDLTETLSQLDWRPPLGMTEAMARTARWYRDTRSG
jgi:UDP-glucose 4-epimerase